MDMTEIFPDVGSTDFWYGVIFTVLLGVLAYYATRMFDSGRGRISSWRDQRAKDKDKKYQTDLENLFRSPALAKSLRDSEARYQLKGIVQLIQAWGMGFLGIILAALFIAPKWMLLILLFSSALGFFMHYANSSLASRRERLLNDYYSLLAKKDTEGRGT